MANCTVCRSDIVPVVFELSLWCDIKSWVEDCSTGKCPLQLSSQGQRSKPTMDNLTYLHAELRWFSWHLYLCCIMRFPFLPPKLYPANYCSCVFIKHFIIACMAVYVCAQLRHLWLTMYFCVCCSEEIPRREWPQVGGEEGHIEGQRGGARWQGEAGEVSMSFHLSLLQFAKTVDVTTVGQSQEHFVQ